MRLLTIISHRTHTYVEQTRSNSRNKYFTDRRHWHTFGYIAILFGGPVDSDRHGVGAQGVDGLLRALDDRTTYPVHS